MELNKNNNNGDVLVDEKHGGSTKNFVDNLMKQATDAGIKINPLKDGGNGQAIVDPPIKPVGEVKPVDDKKFDYSIFKNVDKKDYDDIDGFLKENKVDNPVIRHRLVDRLDDFKKQQRLATERDVKIKELEKSGIREVEVDKKFTDFVDGLQKDFFGTYAKYQSEYKLPDITSMAKMVASGNTIQARIGQYQTDVLTPEIEEKHHIEKGTFVFDAADAWKSGTPSYDYRIKTADKENEFRGEYQKKNDDINSSAKQMVDIRNQQMEEIKNTYFSVTKQNDGSDEYKTEAEAQNKKFTDFLTKLDTVYNDMKAGKVLNPEENPFIFKNIFRGLFYSELSKIDIQRAASKIHEQYAKHGLRLPRGEMPDDVTILKGKAPDGESGTFKVGDTRFSPQNRFLERVGKQLNN